MKYQINDWIKYNRKVRFVWEITGNKYTIVKKYDFDETDAVYESEIKPIKLTPKILELNGFNFNNDDEEIGTYWDHNDLAINIAISKEFLIIHDVVGCAYVHELQQILRLFGYSDFANNFKI